MCGAGVGERGALVEFVPREEDLEWHERAARGRDGGHPPDALWLCERHAGCGWMLARRLDARRGLDLLRTADEGIDVSGQVPPELAVDDWERILRRALPDFAMELGGEDLEVEEDEQSYYAEDGEIPPGAAHGADAYTWTVAGARGEAWVTRATLYWRGGGVARTDIHVGSSSREPSGWTVWVEPDAGATRFTSAHVTMSGDPSPLMVELLERYGLEPARVRR